MQPRKQSIIESIVNTISGMLISFLIQILIYPALGIPVTIGENILITMVFTFASIGRGYIIRRVFNRWTLKQ